MLNEIITFLNNTKIQGLVTLAHIITRKHVFLYNCKVY